MSLVFVPLLSIAQAGPFHLGRGENYTTEHENGFNGVGGPEYFPQEDYRHDD